MSSYAKHPLLLVAAIAHGVLSLGHTAKGLDMFQHASLSALPNALRATVKTGWYEGSAFFAMIGVLNYKWSQTGIIDSADKVVASMVIALLVGAASSYYRSGDKPTAATLATVAILQGLSARGASI